MSYRIVCDSCTDLPQSCREDEHYVLVPLFIDIDGDIIVDDDTFNQAEFLAKMAASPNCPKSSCPSPESYMSHFDGADDIYVVTLSANLSGSYNSAALAAQIYKEKHPDKNICLINSKSATIGQTLIAMKVQELCEEGKDFEQVSEEALAFRDSMQTKFVLESLENLRKNGRLSKVKALLATALNIKPVMTATPEGEIAQLGQARGINRALKAMIAEVPKDAEGDSRNRVIGIAHCNNYARALYVKDLIEKELNYKEVLIVDTAGIASLYANDGGIVIAY